MDLVEIFEVIFGAFFFVAALIATRKIFGGIFYTKKVRAVVGEKRSETYVMIDGQRYTGRNNMNLAEQRDRRRHRQNGNRKKQRYREHSIDHISFTYDDGGTIRTTDPKSTICPVSTAFVKKSGEYNIKVSRRKPWKARLGLFEILRDIWQESTNIVMKFIASIIVIGNALLYVASDVGLAAFGVLLIKLGTK